MIVSNVEALFMGVVIGFLMATAVAGMIWEALTRGSRRLTREENVVALERTLEAFKKTLEELKRV